MNVGHNSARQMRLIFRSPPTAPRFANVCLNCRDTARSPRQRRKFGSAAAAASIDYTQNPSHDRSSEDGSNVSVNASLSLSPYGIATGVVVSRPPILTRELSDFENAFYFYQRRLNERLSLPFTPYFYYKRKTLAEAEYKKKQAMIQRYNPYREGWKDELLVGDYRWKENDLGFQRLLESTVTGEDATEAEKGEGSIEGEVAEEVKRSLEKPLQRETEADRKNDTRSLNRKMSRTLYLLVQNKRKDWRDFGWKFPQSDIIGNENLREAAARTLEHSCGVNMNTWLVGNVPIGHYKYDYPKGYADSDGDYLGKKVFFMKCRIMAGQADLKGNSQGLEDFQWLTKEEVKPVVGEEYFSHIRHMLVSN